MSEIENQLPADIDTLHALMVAACAERDAAIAERETAIGERDRALSQIDRLRHLLRQLQRAHFGKRSEKLDPDQLLLTLEDIEQAIAGSEANDDKKDAIAAKVRAEKRRANRGALPRHLPRVDVTIAPEDTNCPCCRTPMHVIGEETSERLDVIPAQFRVIVTHRPKYACRACEEAPVQAPAPERLIKGGLPTEAMVAYVLAAKYAWHLPLYRQAQILLSQGVAIERATLAFWVGYAAAELKPLYLRLRELILGSLKIAVDETVAPVLDPGRGRTKKGYFWAIARDDRPWGGTDPPAIAGSFASSKTAASNSTPASSREVCVPLCSIERTRSSPATIKGRRTGQPSPRLSRPANCMASIRKPTSPTCSQNSSISGQPRASTSSCPGPGRRGGPPIASRREPRARNGFALAPSKNQAVRAVGSENRLRRLHTP